MEAVPKRFNEWNIEKQRLEQVTDARVEEREVWWCMLGENIGTEISGKHEHFERPGLVMKVFPDQGLWILPLTSQYRIGPNYYPFLNHERLNTIILSQLRYVSTKRLVRRAGIISKNEFEIVKSIIKGIL